MFNVIWAVILTKLECFHIKRIVFLVWCLNLNHLYLHHNAWTCAKFRLLFCVKTEKENKIIAFESFVTFKEVRYIWIKVNIF